MVDAHAITIANQYPSMTIPFSWIKLRSDGSPESDAAARLQTARAMAAGVPVFHNFAMASRALRALASFEKFHFMKQDRAAAD